MFDPNVQLGINVIRRIKQRFNELAKNHSGDLPIDFCCKNHLGINKTFFDRKVAWHPKHILNEKTLNSVNFGRYHNLVLGKFRFTPLTKRKRPESKCTETLLVV